MNDSHTKTLAFLKACKRHTEICAICSEDFEVEYDDDTRCFNCDAEYKHDMNDDRIFQEQRDDDR